MASPEVNNILRYFTKVAAVGGASGRPDGWLLDRFARERDEAAFEELVHRHGPMVLSVCRRILADPHDAEDAFQAAFLILVRKASTIPKHHAVGGWLHGVARRTARKARTMAARRRHHESTAATAPRTIDPPDNTLNEFRMILDEEVQRLPEPYRTPFVLCYLEGVTYQDAARLLACPLGTLAARLSRARKRLQERLTKRGIGLAVGTVSAVLAVNAASGAAVPAFLRKAVVRAGLAVAAGKAIAGGAVSNGVLALLERVPTRTAGKTLLSIAAAVVAIGVAAGSLGLMLRHSASSTSGAAAAPVARAEMDTDLAVRQLFEVRTARAEQIFSVALSADGTRAATGHSCQVKIWNVKAARELAALDIICAFGLAFSPDATMVVTGDIKGNVRVWDSESGRLRLTLNGHASRVNCVSFSPDGKLLASAGYDNAVRLWDLSTGTEVGVLQHENAVCSVAFSPDGKSLATADGMGKVLRTWDVSQRRVVETLRGHEGSVFQVAYTSDGATVASADGDGVIKLWNAKTAQCVGTLARQTGPINGLAIVPGSTHLVSAGYDTCVRVWNIRTREQVHTIRKHTSTVWSVACSSDGKILAAAGDDAFRCWELKETPVVRK